MIRCGLYRKDVRDPFWNFIAVDHCWAWERPEFRDAAEAFEQSDISFGSSGNYVYVLLPDGPPPSTIGTEEMKTWPKL